jgi:hypothetical protein
MGLAETLHAESVQPPLVPDIELIEGLAVAGLATLDQQLVTRYVN